jgi:hypothetical protein
VASSDKRDRTKNPADCHTSLESVLLASTAARGRRRRRAQVVASLTIPAKSVIEEMTGNHEAAPRHGDCHFGQVRWQAIPKVSSCKYQKRTAAHKKDHPGSAVAAVPEENGQSTENSYRHRETSMDFFLRG